MRVDRPHKTGIIWWNLLDGWPQMSDAVVDYYYTKKLAYHYIKISQAPFTIAADEPQSGNLKLYACNDTLEKKSGTYRVTDADTGEILASGDFTAGVNGSFCIAQFPVFYSEQKMLLIEWEANGEKGFNHYLCGYPAFSLQKYRSWVEKLGL
jgi:beta-mannosidase